MKKNKLIANYKKKNGPKRHILCPDDGKRSLCGRFIPAHFSSYDPSLGRIQEWVEQNSLKPFNWECKTCFRILANENPIV